MTIEVKNGKKKTNTCLLLFEIIACISIIFIHVRFPSRLGSVAEMFARFAPPFFFIISGFYLAKNGNDVNTLRSMAKKKICKFLILFLICFVTYLILYLLIYRNDLSLFCNFFSLDSAISFILFNQPFFAEHLWFLLAMIYSYIFIYFFPKLFLKENFVLYFLSSLLLFTIVLHLVSYQFNYVIFGKNISHSMFYRNWLLNGLPFLSLGVLLRKKENKLLKMKMNIIIILMVISIILMFTETYLYRKFLNNAIIEFCFFNILFCISIIMLSIKKPLFLSKSKFLNIKGNWTLYMYMFHPAIILILDEIYACYNFVENMVWLYLEPIFVVIVSIMLALLINFIVNNIRNKINTKNS